MAPCIGDVYCHSHSFYGHPSTRSSIHLYPTSPHCGSNLSRYQPFVELKKHLPPSSPAFGRVYKSAPFLPPPELSFQVYILLTSFSSISGMQTHLEMTEPGLNSAQFPKTTLSPIGAMTPLVVFGSVTWTGLGKVLFW